MQKTYRIFCAVEDKKQSLLINFIPSPTQIFLIKNLFFD